MKGIKLRAGGGPADAAAILELWDGAITWMVARGQVEQWGSEPASARPRTREMVQHWTSSSGLTIAELDERPVGVSVLTPTPPAHVAAIERSESYLHFLLSSRDHAGKGIGAVLVRHASAEARAAGSEVLRVDCWAGAPALVRWYEQQGFRRSDTFVVQGWKGQVFEMEL